VNNVHKRIKRKTWRYSMQRVQALIIMTSDDSRTVTMSRCVGDLVGVEMDRAVVMIDGEEVRVPVHLVRGMNKPDVLQSAIAQLSAEALDDRACLWVAVGEVIERGEPAQVPSTEGEYMVPGLDFERLVDAFARVAGA